MSTNLLRLLLGTSGESSLHSVLGRWRQKVATTVDGLDATVASIITTTVQPLYIANLVALRATVVTEDDTLAVSHGYFVAGDGGGGFWGWSNTAATDNGVTIVNTVVGSFDAGWRRIYQSPLDARWCGTVGNGVADDLLAIRRGLTVLSTLGAGTLFLPNGTYRVTDYLAIPSNVSVQGAGRGATRVVLDTAVNAYGFVAGPGTSDFGLYDLTVAANAVGATTQTTPIFLQGTAPQPVLRGTINNVAVEHATFASFFSTYSQGLQIGSLYVSDQKVCSDGLGGFVGGVAVWLFKGTQRLVCNTISVDGTDSDGVFMDTGTRTGGADLVDTINIGQLQVSDWCRYAPSTGAVLAIQGATNVQIGSVTGRNGSVTALSLGVTILQDQNGTIPKNVQIGQVLLDTFGGYPLQFRGAQGCSVGSLVVKDPLQYANTAGATGYIIMCEPTSALLNGVVAADTSDNFVGSVEVSVTAGAGARYDYGVLFLGDVLTRPDTTTTPSNCLRNRIASSRWGTGAAGTLNPTAVYNAVALGGTTAPVRGVDANILAGYAVDNQTALFQGAPLKVDVPSYGYGQFGPLTNAYCHVTSDLPFYSAGGPSAGSTNTWFHNGVFACLGTFGANTGLVQAGGRFRLIDANGPTWMANAGSPEGVVTAAPGSFCSDTTNGEIYIKSTTGGVADTGWKLVTHS